MKIAVSSQGDTLDAAASPVFGRCPTYLFIEPETMEFEVVPNPAMNQAGGAGIQAAQFVVNQGAGAVLSGNLGPNAYDVLQAAGVPGFLVSEGTVRQAVEAYKAGQLQPMGGPNVGAHAGMRGGRRGMGRGRQMASPPRSAAGKETELAELRETLKGLRQQLAETMEKIEKLEED
jgi:predicted Fe-Mo cluster-binding NifX family protein